MRERPEDIWLGYCGRHPELPAGFNSWEVNGDEVDGAGANEPIWPPLTDFYVGLKPVLNDQNDLDRFADECPDLIIRQDWRPVTIQPSWSIVQVRRRAA